MATSYVFALLVNPRDGVLYYADKQNRRTVATYNLLSEVDSGGQGYFEADEDNEYAAAATITGYPRVHTPSGVSTKGSGNGTVLYTALCVAAHMEDEGTLKMTLPVSGDGISSMKGTRSESADNWWGAAKDRYGLAEEVEGTVSKQVTFDYSDLRGAGFKARQLEQAIASETGWENVDVSDWHIEGTYGTEEEQTADTYPYANATEKHLVLALIEDPDPGSSIIEAVPVDAVEVIDLPALLAANFAMVGRDLAGNVLDADERDKIVRWLLDVLGAAKATPSDLRRVEFRLRTGMDLPVGTDVDQPTYGFIMDEMQLFRRPKLAAPASPLRYRIVGPPARTKGLAAPSAPVSPKELDAEAERLAAARTALGWGAFADDTLPP